MDYRRIHTGKSGRALICLCLILSLLLHASIRPARSEAALEGGGETAIADNMDAPDGDPMIPEDAPVHTPADGDEVVEEIALGDVSVPDAFLGECVDIAVSVMYTDADGEHRSNAGRQTNSPLPYAEDLTADSYDQAIAAVLAEAELSVVTDAMAELPFDLEQMEVSGRIVSDGVNYGYARIKGLCVRPDAQAGEYRIPIQIRWRSARLDAESATLYAEIQVTVIGAEPTAQSLEWGDGVIVYTFEELRAAASSGEHTTIYLGYDEAINGGAIAYKDGNGIPVGTSLTIDGTDPLTGKSVRLTDYPGVGERQGLYASAGGLSVTFRNLSYTGPNWYGMFYGNGKPNIDLRFENVNYTGRQMAHNVGSNSTVTFTGCAIRITNVGSGDEHELAETTGVTFYGSNTIERTGPQINSIIWLKGTGSYTIRIAAGAKVNMTTTDYMIYTESPTSTRLIVEGTLDLTTTGDRGSVSFADQYINVLSVAEGGKLTVSHGSANRPTLMVKSLSVQGTLEMRRNDSTYLLVRLEPGGTVDFAEGAEVLLNHPGGRLLRTREGTGTMNWTTAVINRYANGALADVWNNADMSPFQVSFTINTGGGAISSVQNLSEDARGAAIGAVALSGQAIRLVGDTQLVLGSATLALNTVYADAKSVSGRADAGAAVTLTEYEYSPQAGLGAPIQTRNTTSDGWFSLRDNPFDEALKAGRRVYAVADTGEKVSYTYTTVLPSPVPTIDIPKNLAFQTVRLSSEDQLIAREDADWRIVIGNLHPSTTTFRLYARLDTPLSTASGDQLEGGLVFSQGDRVTPLTEDDLLIARIDPGNGESTQSIKWTETQGILAHLPAFSGVPDQAYRATITWSFVEGP